MVNQESFMTRYAFGILILSGIALAQQPKPVVRPQPPSDEMTVEAQKTFVSQYCAGCHNDTAKIGGMTLTSLDLAHPEQTAELGEKVIKKLRTGLMPPATSTKRPDRDASKAFLKTLEVR